jgi:hypothetical protein
MFDGESGKPVGRPKRTWREKLLLLLYVFILQSVASEMGGLCNGPRNCVWSLSKCEGPFAMEGRGNDEMLCSLERLLCMCLSRTSFILDLQVCSASGAVRVGGLPEMDSRGGGVVNISTAADFDCKRSYHAAC